MKIKLKNSKIILENTEDFEQVSCHLGEKPRGWIHPSFPNLLLFSLHHPYIGQCGLLVVDREFKLIKGFRHCKLKDIRSGELDLNKELNLAS